MLKKECAKSTLQVAGFKLASQEEAQKNARINAVDNAISIALDLTTSVGNLMYRLATLTLHIL